MITLCVVLALLTTVMLLGVIGVRYAKSLLKFPSKCTILETDSIVSRDAHSIRRMLKAAEEQEARRVHAVCAGHKYWASEHQEKYDFIMDKANKLAKKHKLTIKQLASINRFDNATGKLDLGTENDDK